MYYDVFIPSPDSDGYDVTITVDADNWMSALKSGLQRTGEGADAVRNVMCDIKDDNSIHVTDATTQRVFVLKEITEEEYEHAQDTGQDLVRHDEEEEAASPAPTQKMDVGAEAPEQAEPQQTQQPPPEKPAQKPDTGVEQPDRGVQQPDTGAAQPEGGTEQTGVEQPSGQQPPPQQPASQQDTGVEQPSSPPPAQQQAQPQESAGEDLHPSQQPAEPEGGLGEEHSYVSDDGRVRIGSSTHEALQEESKAEDARVVSEKRERTDEKRAVSIGRQQEKVSESLIEDVFLEIQDIHEGDKQMEDVVDFVLDMAMDKIQPESGSVLFADVNGRELYFASARGPKSDEIMDYRVPMGEGIVGFCAREGVSLAISDVEQDPRFYKEISEAIGYDTQNLICAPVQHDERVYGAIELINKSAGSFDSNEMSALSYMARQLGQFVFNVIMESEKLAHEK